MEKKDLKFYVTPERSRMLNFRVSSAPARVAGAAPAVTTSTGKVGTIKPKVNL